MARALERDELIAKRHLTAHLMIVLTIERIFIVGTVVVVVTYHTEPYFFDGPVGGGDTQGHGIVDSLFETA